MQEALEGVKVLDFSQLLQGPYATQMMGDLGADIIKIERNGTGDIYRGMTFLNKWIAKDESPCFMAWNRNKRSLSIDIKSEEGKEIIYKLVKDADVVVENFRPGVMARLGFGYEDLKKINPSIIYCSASGWGADGPYVTRPGQDLLVQSVSGAAMTSGKKSDSPVVLGTSLCDQVNGLNSVYAILAALYFREKTGKGQEIKTNLLSSAIAFQMQDFFAIQNLNTPFVRPESNIGHPGSGAPFGTYKTSDGYLTIAMNPWAKLVKALGEPKLMQYDDAQVLYDKRDEVHAAIEAVTITKTADEWLDIMLEMDLWVAKVHDQSEVEHNPQVIHNKTFVEVEHPKAGKVKVTNIPFYMSETPGQIKRPSPMLGEHGEEILAELGLSKQEIQELIDKNVITIERL
ncbi:CaiB/BaiF CoA transferase family protein [Algibacter pectinivorans]|uniref:Crotonobetainyl-CoA:carnitine CoA-transferase CaiB n=1 Tax=Algibacter pectinivorans TaxID=870482 RepID=A0A1I1PT67_9FLAO|nr:CaiB/BaiF CoA-transferase family protein [Algibacter pectinivorans]SFD12842.1 Crotonobetainyl-CoA:carnitine CoA-transferase CaiB [Algibacter pectinivorans]